MVLILPCNSYIYIMAFFLRLIITVYLLIGMVIFLHSQIQTVPRYDQTKEGFLVFHPIQTDADGKIIPWYSPDLGKSYNHVIRSVWEFWQTMRQDINGLPYYMNHQVWRPHNDPRGIGGDQLAMTLSSWTLLYQYTGDERIKENMKFIADYYLTHSLSPANAKWPRIPYPYNSLTYSGMYDGDMVIGKNFTQPDKAGSFGIELIHLYKIINQYQFPHATEAIYLESAIDIANTLAKNSKPGNADASPMPFKVNAITGEIGTLRENTKEGIKTIKSAYTTNWVGTLELFEELIKMKKGNTPVYKNAHTLILNWMKAFPLKNNKWGPFFEDIPGWSDTQINAVTFAKYIMEHTEYFPNWKSDVKNIFDWVYKTLGNNQWEKYGVIVINEQTAYQTPGNSHSSRQAAAELQYAMLSGDKSYVENATRMLSWATYMVDRDGKNNYPRDEVWLTDGYGDYIRHYLRAMSYMPELAPSHENHILHSTSIVGQADYGLDQNKRLSNSVSKEDLPNIMINYSTYNIPSIETIRLIEKPAKVIIGKNVAIEVSSPAEEGYVWTPLNHGGILKIIHSSSKQISIYAASNVHLSPTLSYPIPLFNGLNLDGWHIDVPALDSNPLGKSPFVVRDGKMVSLAEPGGHIITDAKYSNYSLDIEYRFAGKPGNCGVLVHASKPRRLYEMFPQSIEVQLMHKNAGDFWCIGEDIEVPEMEKRRGPKENWGVDGNRQRRIINLTDHSEKREGEWNHMHIECLSRQIKVWLNGDLVNYGFNATVGEGQIALQAEGSEVEFRKVVLQKIERLTE